LLRELRADHVHIMVRGRIETSGGPELADVLEAEGYKAFGVDEAAERAKATARPEASGPFGNPFEDGFPSAFPG
jgi:Fe-S cluster assembly ATP-binding protein